LAKPGNGNGNDLLETIEIGRNWIEKNIPAHLYAIGPVKPAGQQKVST